MKLFPTGLTALVLAALVAGPALAADQTLLGSSFQMKNQTTTLKRKVQVKAKEKGSSNTLVGNPAMAGGAVLSIQANGTTPSSATFLLPYFVDSKGKGSWTGDTVKGFKYKDSVGIGPVKSAKIKRSSSGNFTLQIQMAGQGVQLPLTPPNIGTDACVLLQLGGGDGYSVKFTGGTIVNKGLAEYSHKKVTTEGLCTSCNDFVQNQDETDVDCGGSTCGACPPGEMCNVPGDCLSGVCTAGYCQAPTCSDGLQNQDETCVDGGGVCVATCPFGAPCVVATDCTTGLCSGGTCKCPNQAYTFNVSSNSGGVFDSAEWPGGTANQSAVSGCGVTINRPNNNVDLVCTIAGAYSINSITGYSNCFGTGGEDGDGCQVNSCPPAGVGSCCNARPSCSAALNGSATSSYSVQCLQ